MTERATFKTSAGRIALRSLGFVLLAALWLSIDWSHLPATADRARAEWLAAAAPCFFLFTVAKALRWRLLLESLNIHYGLGRAIRVYLASAFLAFVTPGRIGDLAKVGFLKADLHVPLSTGLASTLADRLLDIAVLCLIALGALLTAAPSGQLRTSLLAILGLGVLGGALLAQPRVARPAADRLTRLPGVGPPLRSLFETWQQVYTPLASLWTPALLPALMLTFLQFALLFTGAFALAQGLGVPLGFGATVYCITVSSVVSLLPISVSGVGTRDAALVVLFSTFGIDAPQALSFSLAYLVASLVFSNGVGCYFWLSQPPSLSNREHLA